MRNKALRRHQAIRHMNRRLSEDRNQHYEYLSCPCYWDPKARARFKEQPKTCSCSMCCNPRRRRSREWEKLTIPEIKNLENFRQQMQAD